MSFHDFIHLRFPLGLGVDYATIEKLIADDTAARNAYDRERARGPGGANNPYRDPETGRMTSKPLNVDNIHVEDGQPQRSAASA